MRGKTIYLSHAIWKIIFGSDMSVSMISLDYFGQQMKMIWSAKDIDKTLWEAKYNAYSNGIVCKIKKTTCKACIDIYGNDRFFISIKIRFSKSMYSMLAEGSVFANVIYSDDLDKLVDMDTTGLMQKISELFILGEL